MKIINIILILFLLYTLILFFFMPIKQNTKVIIKCPDFTQEIYNNLSEYQNSLFVCGKLTNTSSSLETFINNEVYKSLYGK